MEQLIRQAREEADASEEQVDITIDVPDHAIVTAAHIRGLEIDGVLYPQGQRITTTRKKAESLRETMLHSWRHDDYAFGRKNPNDYRRRNGAAISPHGVVGKLTDDNRIVRF